MNEYEIAIVLVTISLFGASMYQANLIRSEKKLNQKPVLSFHLDFHNNRLNLDVKNMGNGLAKEIELVIKTVDHVALKPELKVKHSGLAKGDSLLVNNWQKRNFVGVGYHDFNCEVSGFCKDIFNDRHWIYEKLHFDSK